MLILTADDVRRALPMRAAIETQRRAFVALAAGRSEAPLRTAVHGPPEGAVTLFMPARVGDDVGAKVVSLFPRNEADSTAARQFCLSAGGNLPRWPGGWSGSEAWVVSLGGEGRQAGLADVGAGEIRVRRHEGRTAGG